MQNTVAIFILLALGVSAASVTLTRAKISKSMREWVSDHSKFFGELLQCPYCTSHWLAALAVLFYQPRISGAGTWWAWIVDMVMAIFVVVALSSFSSGLILKAFDFTVHDNEKIVQEQPQDQGWPLRRYGVGGEKR